ncbi:hypothetical protein HQ308_03625 [Rhodococcus sp. BP-241]|nr:hypothetical protein [Rhodococcus sp. BP-241]MBY6705889.1 hypothetical protein [Rhodococcus sp. BP-241]
MFSVASLQTTLLDENTAPAVRADVRALIDAEVSDKKGASGLAVKGGYGAVKKVSPSVVDDAIAKLWPSFVEKLDPFWQRYQAAPTGTFGEFLAANGDEASDALLSVTDARIDETSKSTIKKAYSSLRPSAKKNVTEALPRVGALVQKYAA